MNSNNRLSLGVVFLACITGAYLFGFNSGKGAVPPESLIANVLNKTDGKLTSTDFGAFWKAWQVINDKFVGTTTSDQDRLYGAISGMTATLGDPYTIFFPPKENKIFAEEIAGAFEGVGMEVGVRDGKLVVVYT